MTLPLFLGKERLQWILEQCEYQGCQPSAQEKIPVQLIVSPPYTCVCGCVLSCVQLFSTPWTAVHQGPLSLEFSRQEYWSRLPFPSPGDIANPGTEPESPESLHWQVDSLPLHHLSMDSTNRGSINRVALYLLLKNIAYKQNCGRPMTADMHMTPSLWQKAKRNERAS